MDHQSIKSLCAQRDTIVQRIATLGDFRPGNLYPTYRRCGKPNCHCAEPDSPGHGPYWLLSRKRRGQKKTVSHAVPQNALQATRVHMERYDRFHELVAELIEVNDALCQARIRGGGNEKKTAARRHPSVAPLRSKRPGK